MKVGELVKLAKWCKYGPALMHVVEIIDSSHIAAMYLEGSKVGEMAPYVSVSNLFAVEDYDEAMRRHDERCGR